MMGKSCATTRRYGPIINHRCRQNNKNYYLISSPRDIRYCPRWAQLIMSLPGEPLPARSIKTNSLFCAPVSHCIVQRKFHDCIHIPSNRLDLLRKNPINIDVTEANKSLLFLPGQNIHMCSHFSATYCSTRATLYLVNH